MLTIPRFLRPKFLLPFRPDEEVERLCSTLTNVYARQRDTGIWNDYLEFHGREIVVWDQVHVFQWYRSFLPKQGRVLDWGCQHAPDTCLLKIAFGNQFERHACDMIAPGTYEAFANYGEFEYRQLDHHVRIPYKDATFDVVIGSGVLEHVAMDYESLKEIHRILKPGGMFIGTYLPNRWSIEEWKRRVLWRRDFHQRRYSGRDVDMLLRHTGFIPERIQIQNYKWGNILRRLGLKSASNVWDRVMKSIVPIHLVEGPTWCFVARSAQCL